MTHACRVGDPFQGLSHSSIPIRLPVQVTSAMLVPHGSRRTTGWCDVSAGMPARSARAAIASVVAGSRATSSTISSPAAPSGRDPARRLFQALPASWW